MPRRGGFGQARRGGYVYVCVGAFLSFYFVQMKVIVSLYGQAEYNIAERFNQLCDYVEGQKLQRLSLLFEQRIVLRVKESYKHKLLGSLGALGSIPSHQIF